MDRMRNAVLLVGHFSMERHKLIGELAIDLSLQGYNVTIITGYPSRGINADIRKKYLSTPCETIHEHVKVVRVGSKRGEGSNLFDRMLRYLFLTKAIYEKAAKQQADVFYIYSTPPFLGWLGQSLSRKAPTLYNAQDLFPDTLLRIIHFSERNPLVSYLRRKERECYQDNTAIVTISDDMKNTLVRNGCPENKISVIYNWVDTNAIYPVQREENKLFDELGINRDDFIVSYAGKIGLLQDFDTVLDAAKLLADNSRIQFVLIGDGAYKLKLDERVRDENIKNVRTFPLQSSSRLSEVYSLGNLEIVSIGKGVTKTSLPSKTWQIFAAGSPVLGIIDKPSELADLIESNALGYCVAPGDANGLVQAVQRAYSQEGALVVMGENARKFAECNVSRGKQTAQYRRILSDLCNSRVTGN